MSGSSPTPSAAGPDRPPRAAGLRGRIALAALSTALSLAALEAGARFWLWRRADDVQFARFATYEQIAASRQLLFARHHYLQYVTRPYYASDVNRHDARGFRGEDVAVPKPPGVFRVVLVGGSTTYDSEIRDYRRSYAHRLQELLSGAGRGRIEVVNAGVHAYASWEHLMNLQFRVLDLDPDLIVFCEAINDVHPRLVDPPEAYRGDNSGSRTPFDRADEAFLDRWSTALRILRTAYGWRQPIGGRAFRRTFEFVEHNYAEQFEQQKLQGTYPSGVFGRVTAAEMLRRNPPVYYERNLRAMVAVAREFGVPIAFMTFAWSAEFPEHPRVASPEYAGALREHNRVVLQICASHALRCYDHAAEMPADRRYWTDGRHVNEAGADVKARQVAAWLHASGLLPRQAENKGGAPDVQHGSNAEGR